MATSTGNLATSKQIALNNAKSPNFQTISGQNISVPAGQQYTGNKPNSGAFGSTQFGTPQFAPGIITPPPAHAPAPSAQPIASHTTKDASGNTTTIKYQNDSPTASKPTAEKTSPSPSPAATNGLVQPNYSDYIRQIGAASTPNTTQTGLVKNISDTAAGNAPIGEAAKKIASDYAEQIARTGALGANAAGGYLTSGGGGMAVSGNAGVASQIASSRMSALSAAETAALAGTGQQLTAQNQAAGAYGTALEGANTQQSTQLGGLGSAAGLLSPVLQFGQLTNPSTGQVIGSGDSGNNPALESAVANAVQMVQNGADPNDALATLGGYSQAGVNAFNNAMQQVANGTYNPTQQSAAAQTNKAQAAAAQENAFNLDSALKQLEVIQPTVDSFLKSSGINSQDNKHFNDALNTYYDNFLSPGNKTLFEAYMGDIKKYTSQILAANTGTIPTDVSNTLANFDPTNLSADQLKPYLQGLAQLGGNQLSVIQKQQKNTGGTSNAYTGTPTSANTTAITAPTITPSSITSHNPVIQGLIGGTLNFMGGVGSTISGFASKVLGVF